LVGWGQIGTAAWGGEGASGIGGTTGAGAYAQDHDIIADDLVANDAGADRKEFPERMQDSSTTPQPQGTVVEATHCLMLTQAALV